jgi:hypothetical protein
MNLTFVGEFFKIREPKVGPPVHSNLKTLKEKDRNNVKIKTNFRLGTVQTELQNIFRDIT